MSTARKGCFECGLIGEHHDDCSRRERVIGTFLVPGHLVASTTTEPTALPDFDALAERIVGGFLVPACAVSPAAYHERWKPVNRAAGVIAGYVASIDPELVDRVRLAQSMTDACLRILGAAPNDDRRHFVELIAGPNGLAKRVAECLVQLGVNQ